MLIAVFAVLGAGLLAWCSWRAIEWLGREPPEGLFKELVSPAARLTAVTYDTSGDYLAAGSASGEVILWNLKSGARKSLPRMTQVPVTTLASSPDGFLMAGTADHRMYGWQIEGDRVENLPELPAPVTHVAVRPGHFELAIGLSDGQLLFLDRERLSKSTSRQPRGIKSAVYTPDGKFLITGSTEGKLCWHNAETRDVIETINAHGTEIGGLAVSTDGRLLASGDWDGEIRIWNIAERTPVANLTQPDAVSAAGFASGLLVTGSWDGRLRFWSVDAWTLVRETDTGSPVYALAVHPNGRSMATVSDRNRVQLWRVSP